MRTNIIHQPRKRTFFLPLVSLITLLCYCPVKAQVDQLSFSISCAKPDLLVAEPLVLRVTVRNAGPSDFPVDTQFGNGTSLATYWISRDGTNFNNIHALLSIEPSMRQTILSPGRSLNHDELLLYDARTRGVIFPIQGDYFIQAKCREWQSNILRLHVKDPASAAEKQWAAAMKSENLPITVTFPAWKTDEAVKTLVDLAREKSVLSLYAAFTLGFAEPNKRKALTHIEKADVETFAMRSRVVLEKARLNFELGNLKKATELADRLQTDFPESTAALDPLIRRIRNSNTVQALARTPMDAAVKELESQWYDVKSIATNSAPWAREYRRDSLEFYELYAQGKITHDEAHRRAGEMLKDYVRKHAKPLTPAEWKRRQEDYEREANERYRKQLEEQKESAEEDWRRLLEAHEKARKK
jgi:polyhydroxyalkanoate synthesis regulator phasin